MSDTQSTLREALEANIAASEAGTLNAPPEPDPIEIDDQQEPLAQEATARDSKSRDENGRFLSKEKDPEVEAEPVEVVPPPTPKVPRPTTWKKDYLPIWDKLAVGAQLTPEEAIKLAEYSHQREKEYTTGVSTYRAEAEHAKNLQDAIAPFMPDLQQSNINPATWISNLGQAHTTLVKGSAEQKLQMFAKLAQDYGVPLGAIGQSQQGQLDPVIPQLMDYIKNLEGKVNTVTSWQDQQVMQSNQQQIAKFQDAEKYPHFEQVRQTMAQLLESGMAPSLDEAYAKAVRLSDDIWQAEQEQKANAKAAEESTQKIAAVAKAKNLAVSTRSSTPSGALTNSGSKDLRATLEAQFSKVGGRV